MVNIKKFEQIGICTSDTYGRLVGKRLNINQYKSTIKNGMKMPDFHLVTNIEGKPHLDMKITGLHTGFKNGILIPIKDKFFFLPNEKHTIFFLSDVFDSNGKKISIHSREILKKKIYLLKKANIKSKFSSELEFYLINKSYKEIYLKGLKTFYHISGDNDILVSSNYENIIRNIKKALLVNNIKTVSTQSEGGQGQFEMNIEANDPLTSADQHIIFKNVVKSVSNLHKQSATFISKLINDEAGSGGHIHFSFMKKNKNLLGHHNNLSNFGESFLEGVLKYSSELMPIYLPFNNSYKRLSTNSFAPINISWGWDNRTTLIRMIPGKNIRAEFRLPGADINPYLAYSAIIGSGLEGVAKKLKLRKETKGDAYTSKNLLLPLNFFESVQKFVTSRIAKKILGNKTHEHLSDHYTRELQESNLEVSDWEIKRGFERN